MTSQVIIIPPGSPDEWVYVLGLGPLRLLPICLCLCICGYPCVRFYECVRGVLTQ